MNSHHILISEDAIKLCIKTLSYEIRDLYGNEELTIIIIMNGAAVFAVDLMRAIENPIRVDCMKISSYGNKTKSKGKPKILIKPSLDLTNRHVLIIDDILDSGKTLSLIVDTLKKSKPASIKTCVLLEKDKDHKNAFKADFVGFNVSDEFVYGYGLDLCEQYRNLPYIAIKT